MVPAFRKMVDSLMMERKEKIISFMREDAYKPLLFTELVTVLDVPRQDIPLFQEVLQQLEEEGKIFKTRKDRYGIPEKMNLVVGRLQGSEKGFGFVIPDDPLIKDVFISGDSLNGAMHNDRVIARINKKDSSDKKAEGEIIRIISRANDTVVGTFESSRYFGFVVPDNSRIASDIFIPKDEINGAVSGQKVVAKITKWPEKRRNAEGRVIEILGDKYDTGVDIVSIIKSYNLSEEFPEEVMREAREIKDKVTAAMQKGRKNLKDLTMVTIDGEDAKDLDDAVSLEILENGLYRLGVHIADVSYYVKEGSELDKEALKRGTSVYLVDRVLPMLPRELSNGICSLNPQVDRLAFTVMMDIDQHGRVVNHNIFESVININERMTYNNVFKILEDEDKELTKRYKDLVPMFKKMKELALILRAKRKSRGAIDFDFVETKVILDEEGKPIEVKPYEITIANQIIEEFMLICNETVAEHFFWTNVPFVYRVHEDPDQEKIEALSEFLHNLGYHIKGINKIHPRALQQLLEEIKGKKEERIINTITLRSLQKARYSHENLGHFGLAAKYYCHFTSPIRRYPDLIIHRIMKEALKGNMKEAREEQLFNMVPEIAKQCSERERAADEAERDTEDLKKVEFMKDRQGEEFDGIISGVTSFGMFVELDNTVEGMVRMSSMEDDYYIYDDKHYCLIGERTRKVYRIGDAVRVKLVKADLSIRKIDFILLDNNERVEKDERDSNQEEISVPVLERKGKQKKASKTSSRVLKQIGAKERHKKAKTETKSKKETSEGKKLTRKRTTKKTEKITKEDQGVN